MDKKGIPQYRCQRCTAGIFDLNAAPIPFETLQSFADNPLASAVNDTPKVLVHNCDDGGAGFAVIIGMLSEDHIQAIRKRMAEQAEAEASGNGAKSKSAAN